VRQTAEVLLLNSGEIRELGDKRGKRRPLSRFGGNGFAWNGKLMEEGGNLGRNGPVAGYQRCFNSRTRSYLSDIKEEKQRDGLNNVIDLHLGDS